MTPDRYAAIDVGTNTILMVTGEKTASGIEILNDYHSIARLGEGVINPEISIKQVLNVEKKF